MKFPDGDRLLAQAELKPVQGSGFQPTGFPSLGPAEFSSIDGKETNLLVESAQSMANRLEKVCWDEKELSLVEELTGLPVITVNDENDQFLTNSLLEAHRMSSSYMLKSKEDTTLVKKLKEELEIDNKESFIDIPKFAKFVFKYDPNSILHGLFLADGDIEGGRYKLTRSLSSFIEATNINRIVSGGVKLDRLDPGGGEEGASKGYGHIPYSRTDYSADSLIVYFNIDLALIRSYRLSDNANNLLLTLALWKIQRFLKNGLRLRSACILDIKTPLKVTYPENFIIPDIDTLNKELKDCIGKCQNNDFGTPLVITYKRKGK